MAGSKRLHLHQLTTKKGLFIHSTVQELSTDRRLLTYSMQNSPSWEANRFSANQEIPYILWNSKVHYHTHKRLPPVPTPRREALTVTKQLYCTQHMQVDSILLNCHFYGLAVTSDVLVMDFHCTMTAKLQLLLLLLLDYIIVLILIINNNYFNIQH